MGFGSVLLTFLNEEENRWKVVQDLLNEAHAGRIEIITSSFALVEVLKVKGHDPIAETIEQKLTEFFEYPFIKVVNADREICEASRRYVWKHGMKSKDAVHMATAEMAKRVVDIHGLFSWDDDFVKHNGKTGFHIPISHPFMQQGVLHLEAGEIATDENPTGEEPDEKADPEV